MLGRPEAMIDLAAGFDMNASGRENIYIRGALLGRPRAELASREADIVDFAELEDAIDAPVSTYSSGMLMRLAFSTVVATSPDLLLIDEILAVGDFSFRQKCLGRIRELRESAAFVFVTHSMSDVRSFCDRVIVLHKGRVVFVGVPDEAIEYYEKVSVGEAVVPQKAEGVLDPQYLDDGSVCQVERRWLNQKGEETVSFLAGETVQLEIEIELNRPLRKPIFGVPVWNSAGEYVTGFSTQIASPEIQIEGNTKHRLVLTVPNCGLNPGEYHSNLSISDGPEFVYRLANPPLTVLSQGKPSWGVVTLSHEWRQVQ